MEDGFADFSRMEVPPDDLLVNDFSDELFDMDDYLNELMTDNLDTGRFYLLFLVGTFAHQLPLVT